MTEEERQEKIKRIAPFQTYDEYTEEEKRILPPLPEDAERIKNRESYVWTGFCWDIEYRGW